MPQVLTALEAELELIVRWRGGELDRVVDEGHARLTATTIGRLEQEGWIATPEVTYAIAGDRGAIDVLGYQAAARALLVIEVKTELTSAEATLRRHDEKVRLAREIARARFRIDVRTVSRLLVLPESTTARRRIERHAELFDRTYPLRGSALRVWLRRPDGPAGGLLFLPPSQSASDRRDLTSRRRVTRTGQALAERGQRPDFDRRAVRFIDSSTDHSPAE